MKKRIYTGILAAALLLAGCNNNGGEEIDLAPFPMETEDTRVSLDELRKSNMTPFIMPQEGTEEYEYYSSLLTWGDDCVPGQLYLLSSVSNTEKAILKLSDTVFRIETGLVNVQPIDRRKIYAVAVTDGGDRLMKIDQETGQETVLYNADGRTIDCMTAPSYLSGYSTLREGDYLYFSDGGNIMRFNFFTEEIMTLVENETRLQELTLRNYDLAWQDIDGAYYVYNTGTGEVRPTTYEELYPFSDDYSYDFRAREDEPEIYDLYLLTRETFEEELIVENITNIRYATTDVLMRYAQVGNEYIISINNTYGDIETVYTAATDDMELLSVPTRWNEVTEDILLGGIYVREENEIVRVDGETLEASTLFTLENGLSEFNCSPFAQDNRSRFVYFFDEDDDSMDIDSYYICGECSGDDLNYCVWADKDGNWFWYHPHSGENEEIEVIIDEWERYFIKQADRI